MADTAELLQLLHMPQPHHSYCRRRNSLSTATAATSSYFTTPAPVLTTATAVATTTAVTISYRDYCKCHNCSNFCSCQRRLPCEIFLKSSTSPSSDNLGWRFTACIELHSLHVQHPRCSQRATQTPPCGAWALDDGMIYINTINIYIYI